MKARKVIKISLSIVGTLLLFLICTVLFWLGPTVKLIAQQVGSKALGTPLTINTLSINPKNGTIHLSDFAIANPETFGKSNAVSLVSLDVAVDLGSIFTQTVVVHQVALNSPHFIYEQSSASDNITEFILNIQEFVGYDPSAPPPPNPKKLERERKKKEKKAGKKKGKVPKIVKIESLVINDVQFHLANQDDELLDFNVGFEQLSVSTTNGIVQLDQFYISNPGRLQTPNLFALEQLEILLNPDSIYSTNIYINAIHIRKPHAFVEHNPETDTLGEFLNIASELMAKIPTNAPKASETHEPVIANVETEPPPPPPEVTFDLLTIDDVQFHLVNMGDPDLSVHMQLDQLAVGMDQGTINLDNLFFTNPKRLDTPNLFSLDGITIDFVAESLKTDTLIVKDVQIHKPHAFLELNKKANTAGEFMKIANGFTERISTYSIPTAPQPPLNTESKTAKNTPPAANESTAPPIELHNLLIDDIQIRLLDTTPTNAVPNDPHRIAGINEVSIKLVEGKLQIKEISIPNVKGFMATNLFHLANIDIAIDPASLFSDQVIINTVLIDSPEVNLEQTKESGNVAELQTTLMQFVPQSVSSNNESITQTSKPEEKAQPIPLSEQPILLHQLLVTNLAVNLKLPVITNTTVIGTMGRMDIGKLNPMDKISINKLNPLSAEKDDEKDVDPNAPLTLMAFNQLSLEPLKGLLYIEGMRISNPPGFTRRDLVNLEELRIDLDPDTLQSDTLIIEDILISRPRIRYERQIMSDNIKALQKEIEQATMRRSEALGKEEKEAKVSTTSEEEEGQKVIIEHLLIPNGMVRAKLSAMPSIPVPLPTIEMNDIGKEKGGASASEASSQIFNTVYDSMIGAVSSTTGFAGDTIKGVGSFGMGALGSVTDGVTGGLGNVVNKKDNPADSEIISVPEKVEKKAEVEEEKKEENVEKEVKKKKRRRPAARRGLFR